MECNRIAGGAVFGTIADKAECIRAKRQHRHAKLLRMPEWTDDELVEMGARLRSYIVGCQVSRRVIKAQIDWQASDAWVVISEASR
jgi:hypothetical protein